MGNCCGKDDAVAASGTRPARSSNKAFQGEGHRLGTVHEQNSPLIHNNKAAATTANNDIPKPKVDPSLTGDDRDQLRNERVAAAEARMKKQGLSTKPKKKKTDPNAPLVGPNSKPTMTWQMG